jgi:RNA polymerase sigma factor (sigma-70 family)
VPERRSKRRFDELLAGARRESAEARKEFFTFIIEDRRFISILRPAVRCVLLPGHRVRRFADEDDLLHGAICVAMERFSGFRGRSERDFLKWWISVVRATWNRLARRRYEMPASSCRGLDRQPARSMGPAEIAAEEERSKRLDRALRFLVPRERQVVDLRLRGRSAAEIARALGISAAAARQRASRAMRHILDALV